MVKQSNGSCLIAYPFNSENRGINITKCILTVLVIITTSLEHMLTGELGCIMLFNTTFKLVSTIFQLYSVSWQSVLLKGETGVSRENHPPVTHH
jgi:hypothetical protein